MPDGHDTSGRLTQRLRLLRWLLAAATTSWALVMVATGHAHVCEQQVGDGARVVRVCHPAGATDGVTLAVAAVVLILLLPDVAEVGLGGVLTVRRRLTEASIATEEARRALLVAQTRQVASSAASAVGNAVTIVNGSVTSALALDEEESDAVVGVDVSELSDEEQLLGELRYAMAERFMRGVDATRGPLLADARLHLYLPDDEGTVLLPALDEPDRDTQGWPVGGGLVGRAWAEEATVTGRSDELAASVAGLPEHRRRRYAKLSAVVATPVLNSAGRAIGVLSASSIDEDTRIDSPEAVEELEATAAVMGRLLVDVLGWAGDA